MSGLLARTAQDGPPGDSETARSGLEWLTPVNVIITVATLLAFALRFYYQSTRPGFLTGVTEYDDGPYFGSAVRLVHGVLPYRSFVLVQPPGITLLMSPVAALTYFTGTATGLAIGRLLTALAGTAAVVLGGLLVRHRGPVATLITCGVLAVYADGVAAAHTVLVEPWLVFFCLTGALAVFDRDSVTSSTRRLVWGGAAFGFAGAVEAWAIVPVLVVFLLALPRVRRALLFAGGVAAGFCIPVLPFAVAAPSQLYHSLITAQVGSRAHALRVGLWIRLQNMTGVPGALSWKPTTVLLVVFAFALVVLAAQATAWWMRAELPPALDWFAGLSLVLAVAMFLWPPQFHYHFSAFLAPFVGLTLGLSVARAVTAIKGTDPAGWRRYVGPAVIVAAGLALAVTAVNQAQLESRAPSVIGHVPSALVNRIPAGACVVTDQVSVTLAANRFVSNVPGCPQMIDPVGTDLALSHGLKPQTGAGKVPAVATWWHSVFSHAQYLLLTSSDGIRVAWTPSLRLYLASHFVATFHNRHLTLWARRGLAQP